MGFTKENTLAQLHTLLSFLGPLTFWGNDINHASDVSYNIWATYGIALHPKHLVAICNAHIEAIGKMCDVMSNGSVKNTHNVTQNQILQETLEILKQRQ